MKSILLSIIVPVFNVEQYIQECIDSILMQNYKHFELILVNDGSTDNSGFICDDYAFTNQNIKVIHQKNGGLSNARNKGIRIATGDYIWFIDSDDWIKKDAFEILIKELKNDTLQMLGFFESRFIEEKNILQEYSNHKAIATTSGNNYLIENNKFVPAACFYIYKTAFIKENQFFFKEKMLHEDDYFNLICFSKVERIKKISQTLYFYRIRKNSILRSKVSEQRLISYVELIKLSKTLLESNLENIFIDGLIRSYISILFVYLNQFQKNKNEIQQIIKDVKQIIPKQNYHFKDKKGVLLEKLIYNFSSKWYLKYKSIH